MPTMWSRSSSRYMDLKKKVFKQLDEITKKDVILTTNTSSMSITEIAKATTRPDKVCGMHFFNPVPLMRLVEVIRGFHSSDETIKTSLDLARKFGKEPIEVKKDIPCFVVNRLMMPHFIEAIWLLQENIARQEDIDKAAKLGLNYPMGPFELMDLTGIDIALQRGRLPLPGNEQGTQVGPPRTDERHDQGEPLGQENGRRMVRL